MERIRALGGAALGGLLALALESKQRSRGIHVLEARGKRISEVSARLTEADAETLRAEIRQLARKRDYPFAAESFRPASTGR
jgi:hypothetical protein